MTTSAYNLGKSGLASKILRTMDLMLGAGAEGCSVLGIEVVLGLPSLRVRLEFGGGLPGISQFGAF
jgi:hypothetical protein